MMLRPLKVTTGPSRMARFCLVLVIGIVMVQAGKGAAPAGALDRQFTGRWDLTIKDSANKS
jgi:hypothetical protein